MLQGGVMVNAQADVVQQWADNQQQHADDKALEAAEHESENTMEAARNAQDTASSSQQCVENLREKAQAMADGRHCKKKDKKSGAPRSNIFKKVKVEPGLCIELD